MAACGVCRTDLHVVEGELPPRKSPVIPGHQVVGRIDNALSAGDQWAFHGFIAPAVCVYCRAGKENLCDDPAFSRDTSWMVAMRGTR